MTRVIHSHEVDIMFQPENFGSIASLGFLYLLKLLIQLALIKAMQKNRGLGLIATLSQRNSFAFCIKNIAQLYSISLEYGVGLCDICFICLVPHE